MRYKKVYIIFVANISKTLCPVLSESAEVCERYDKDILAYFFSWTPCRQIAISANLPWSNHAKECRRRNTAIVLSGFNAPKANQRRANNVCDKAHSQK